MAAKYHSTKGTPRKKCNGNIFPIHFSWERRRGARENRNPRQLQVEVLPWMKDDTNAGCLCGNLHKNTNAVCHDLFHSSFLGMSKTNIYYSCLYYAELGILAY